MRLAYFLPTLLLSAATPFTCRAEDQRTIGACSPAVSQTGGNVAITCIMPDNRIKIAKFDDLLETPDALKKLGDCTTANAGKIIWSGPHFDRTLGATMRT